MIGSMSNRRVAAWIFLVTVLVLVSVTALVWTQRRALAHRAIVAWLAENDVEALHLDVHRLHHDRLILRDLWLRAGAIPAADLRIARLEIRWDPLELPAQGLGALRMEAGDAKVLMATSEGPVEISMRARGSGIASDRLAVDLELNAVHPQVRGKVHLLGELVLDRDVRGLTLELVSTPLSGSWGGEAESLRFEGELPKMRWVIRRETPDVAAVLRVEGEGGRFFAPLYEFEADGIELAGEIDSASWLPTGRLVVRSITNRVLPGHYPVLALHTHFVPRDDALDFDFELFDPKRILGLQGTGSHATGAGKGELTFELSPLRFDPKGARPSDLFPARVESLEEVRGALFGDGRLRWGDGDVSGVAHLSIDALGFETSWGSVTGIEGRLELVGPFPIHMKSVQRVDVKRLAAGAELLDGIFELQLREDGKVDLARLQWRFAEGVLRTRGVYDPLADTQAFDLRAEGIDLGALFAMLELDGLTGEGRLEGTLPLEYDGRSLLIREGRLESTGEGGRIRYQPDAAATAVAQQGANFGLVYAVLENFRYQRVVLELNGDLLGEVRIEMKLSGSNPEYQGGTPVEFNLDLEANFADLVRGGSAFYGVQERIERKLNTAREKD
jgi:hypothetical protein